MWFNGFFPDHRYSAAIFGVPEHLQIEAGCTERNSPFFSDSKLVILMLSG
jgi:hypothetical protein